MQSPESLQTTTHRVLHRKMIAFAADTMTLLEISETVGSPYVFGQRLQQYLGVDGGIDPGQPTTQVVQLFSKHFLALLQLFQNIRPLIKNRTKRK